MKPEYGHHDDTYRLPKRRRDALGAYGLVGLSEQPDDGVAKSVQCPAPAGRGCLFDARADNTRGS
jgi:hypothetical protein